MIRKFKKYCNELQYICHFFDKEWIKSLINNVLLIIPELKFRWLLIFKQLQIIMTYIVLRIINFLCQKFRNSAFFASFKQKKEHNS